MKKENEMITTTTTIQKAKFSTNDWYFDETSIFYCPTTFTHISFGRSPGVVRVGFDYFIGMESMPAMRI